MRFVLGFLIKTTFCHETNSIAFEVFVKQETMVIMGYFYNPEKFRRHLIHDT